MEYYYMFRNFELCCFSNDPKWCVMWKRIITVIFIFLITHSPINAQGLSFEGSYDSLGYAVGVEIHGGIFVIDRILGLMIFQGWDLPDSSFLGRFPIPEGPSDIEIASPYVYVTTASTEPYSGGILAINPADPANPYLVGELSFGTNEAFGITVAPSRMAYIANGGAGVRFVWTGVPENLDIVNTFDTPGSAMDVAVKGHFLYVADGTNGILIVDISDNANPVLVGSCDTPGFARNIDIDDIGRFYAYVDDDSAGLQIIDIGNPTQPFIAANYPVPNTAHKIKAYGSFVHLASESELVMLNVVNPLAPFVDFSASTPSPILGISRNGYSVVAAGGESVSLFSLRYSGCDYVPGDINNNGSFNGIDVLYAVNYFKGGSVPPFSCPCYPYNRLYPAGDVNGNCVFNGIDILYMVRYFGPGGIYLTPCHDCLPY
jgi:hypothetical protein